MAGGRLISYQEELAVAFGETAYGRPLVALASRMLELVEKQARSSTEVDFSELVRDMVDHIHQDETKNSKNVDSATAQLIQLAQSQRALLLDSFSKHVRQLRANFEGLSPSSKEKEAIGPQSGKVSNLSDSFDKKRDEIKAKLAVAREGSAQIESACDQALATIAAINKMLEQKSTRFSVMVELEKTAKTLNDKVQKTELPTEEPLKPILEEMAQESAKLVQMLTPLISRFPLLVIDIALDQNGVFLNQRMLHWVAMDCNRVCQPLLQKKAACDQQFKEVTVKVRAALVAAKRAKDAAKEAAAKEAASGGSSPPDSPTLNASSSSSGQSSPERLSPATSPSSSPPKPANSVAAIKAQLPTVTTAPGGGAAAAQLAIQEKAVAKPQGGTPNVSASRVAVTNKLGGTRLPIGEMDPLSILSLHPVARLGVTA